MEYYVIGYLVIGLISYLIIRNLLRQNEQLEDMLNAYRNQTIKKLDVTLKTLRDIDIRGAFEKDDEVGSVFKDIQNIIKDLKEGI